MAVNRYVKRLESHVHGVERLMSFDRDVMHIAISEVEQLHRTLRNSGLENRLHNAERTLEILRGFKSNDSLRPRYELIFNQALVLLVSYFGSVVGDLFKDSVMEAVLKEGDAFRGLLKEQIKVSLRELQSLNFEIKDSVGQLFLQDRDISFQDMLSIRRAFNDYLGIPIEKDDVVNDIILAQAARHLIVHTGGVADRKFIGQTANALPRSLKPQVREGEHLQFTDAEVTFAAEQMLKYVGRVADAVAVRLAGL